MKKNLTENLYILLGEDDIRNDEFATRLTDDLGAGVEKIVLNCDEANISDIIEKILTPPLFAAKSIVILKNFSCLLAPPERAREIFRLLRRVAQEKTPTTVLLYWRWSRDAQAIIEREGLGRYVINLYKGKDWAIKRDLKEKAKRDGYLIDEEALNLLLEYAGEDYSQIHQEYEKIKLFTDKRRLTREAIEDIISQTKRWTIQALGQAFKTKNKKEALIIITNLLLYKERVEGIIGYITSIFLNMLGREDIAPWGKKEIVKRLKELYELDKKIKTSAGDKETLLLKWVGESLVSPE